MNTETLRRLCLALPAAEETIKWEDNLVFSIGGKMFCITSFNEPFRASLKVADDTFDEWCSQKGFSPAPYLARAKWVSVSKEAGLSLADWTVMVQQSYRLVAAKLTRKQQLALALIEPHQKP